MVNCTCCVESPCILSHIEGFLLQIVVVDYVIWKKLGGHWHVLVSIKWGFEIHVFDVCATELGSWGPDVGSYKLPIVQYTCIG